MIEDHLLKENEIGDRVKVARIVQKLLDTVWDFRTGRGTIGINGRKGLNDCWL